MEVLVVTPPSPFVDLDLAKTHLRIAPEDTDQDVLVEAYIAAACGHVDGPAGWLGRAIGPQVLEARFDSFSPDAYAVGGLHQRIPRFDLVAGDVLNLPYGPILAIASVTYDDPDLAAQTLDPSVYVLDSRGLLRNPNQAWPAAYPRRGAVRVRYSAGYVADPVAETLVAAPPAAIVAATLLMVGDLFQNRETTDTGRVAEIPMSTTVERLLSPYRVWSL